MTMLGELWRRWLVISRRIGNFQSRVLLSLFYFTLIAPFAFALRLFSNPLAVGLDEAPCWRPLPSIGQSEAALEWMRQQF